MRKIVASMLMAMDGVVENHHPWTSQFRSEESQKYKFDELFASDALLLGRITYQGVFAYPPETVYSFRGDMQKPPRCSKTPGTIVLGICSWLIRALAKR